MQHRTGSTTRASRARTVWIDGTKVSCVLRQTFHGNYHLESNYGVHLETLTQVERSFESQRNTESCSPRWEDTVSLHNRYQILTKMVAW